VASWPTIARRVRVPLGFVLAGVYLVLAHPRVSSLAFGAGFILAGLLVRAAASGHVRKNEELTMTGPYAYTRNPLYLGSLIIAVGFAIAARSLWVGFILVAMFVAIYLPVIRAEEAYLGQRFPEFAEYARRVPRLVPGLGSSQTGDGSFSWGLYWKHREYNATLGSVAIMAALVLKLLWAAR
jgi:protein-S-isoprenylcysteine O-methyltransferase Ste14